MFHAFNKFFLLSGVNTLECLVYPLKDIILKSDIKQSIV